MNLEKAIIRKIANGSETTVMTVQFNPENYSLSRNTEYKEIIPIGRDASEGKMQFKNSGFCEFKASLFLDHYTDKKDVREDITILSDLMVKDETTHQPNKMVFAWGSFIFIGALTSMSENYTMFHENGIPIRAKVDITLKGLMKGSEKGKSTREVSTKVKKVIGLEQLWDIAYMEYGQVDAWRTIASINHILNPRKISVLGKLKIR